MFVPVCDWPTVAAPTGTEGRHVMESESATIHRKMRAPPRQLPITGFAHKTGVVGDLRVTALLVLAACDMAAELCRAAVLDRRHHLELLNADMAGIGLTPCRSVGAENIRDLQLWTCQERRALRGRLALGLLLGLLFYLLLDLVRVGPQRREAVERAHDLADRVGGDPRVERRRLELGMAERTRVIMHLLLTY